MMLFGAFPMKALGLSMLVGGVAFLFSGLIFLLPTERKLSKRQRSFQEGQQEPERDPQAMRSERREL
jgi:hypothetical protein